MLDLPVGHLISHQELAKKLASSLFWNVNHEPDCVSDSKAIVEVLKYLDPGFDATEWTDS